MTLFNISADEATKHRRIHSPQRHSFHRRLKECVVLLVVNHCRLHHVRIEVCHFIRLFQPHDIIRGPCVAAHYPQRSLKCQRSANKLVLLCLQFVHATPNRHHQQERKGLNIDVPWLYR